MYCSDGINSDSPKFENPDILSSKSEIQISL